MISPKIEESRIRFGLRGCRRKDLNLYEPMELVKEAFEEFGDELAVSWSAGRCSTAVLHMALQINPNVKVVFGDTTVLYQEDYAYRDFICKAWDLNPYIETKPIMPFWKVWKKYGPPTIRRQYYHSYAKYKGLWKRHTFQEKTGKPACCWFCKDKPFLLACKEHNIEATLVGLRCSESRARMYYAADYGMKHFAKRYKIWKMNPVLFWTRKQLLQYFEEHSIPQSEVYTKLGLERNGCMPCTGFLHWEEQLARINPKMYRYVQKLRGVSLIDDFIELENEFVDKCGIESRQKMLEEWF